jgi:hypothetical protein
VELLDFEERADVEANGIFFKYWIKKPHKNEFEHPSDKDEVEFDLKMTQDDKVLYER